MSTRQSVSLLFDLLHKNISFYIHLVPKGRLNNSETCLSRPFKFPKKTILQKKAMGVNRWFFSESTSDFSKSKINYRFK